MGFGFSTLLLALGTILAFALDFVMVGVDIQVIGWILIVAGVIGLVLTMVVLAPRCRRTSLSHMPPAQLQRSRPLVRTREPSWTSESMTTTPNPVARLNAANWLGRVIIDRDGDKIGKLHDVYVDVETDEPQFGTVKKSFLDRHLILTCAGRR